jgi:hypothetical protein
VKLVFNLLAHEEAATGHGVETGCGQWGLDINTTAGDLTKCE